MLCTERLEMDWMVLAKSFGVESLEKGASIHNNDRKGKAEDRGDKRAPPDRGGEADPNGEASRGDVE